MAAEKETILIVDDDPELRLMLLNFLEGKGYNVLPAEDGDAAFLILEKRQKEFGDAKIKLIISDWMMPETNGIELLTMIRRTVHRAIPFILMSGAVTRDQLVGASKYDPDAILLKPFSLTGVQQKIQQALEVREAKELSKLLGTRV